MKWFIIFIAFFILAQVFLANEIQKEENDGGIHDVREIVAKRTQALDAPSCVQPECDDESEACELSWNQFSNCEEHNTFYQPLVAGAPIEIVESESQFIFIDSSSDSGMNTMNLTNSVEMGEIKE